MNQQEAIIRETPLLTGRRDMLKSLSLTAAGVALAPFAGELPLAAAIHRHLEQQAVEAITKGPWRPKFFNQQECDTIYRLTDLILPSDSTPGAKDAAVTEFLDFYLANSPDPARANFREGLQWLDATARTKFGKPFVELEEAQQGAILMLISSPANSDPGDLAGVNFFKLIRERTVFAFYTSKIGIQELGYVGNTYASEFPGACTHQHEL